MRERLLKEASELAKSNTYDAPDAWPYGRNVHALRSIAGEAEEAE
jgi:hypothetical protein